MSENGLHVWAAEILCGRFPNTSDALVFHIFSKAKQSKATQQEYTVSLLLYLFLSVQAAEQPTPHGVL